MKKLILLFFIGIMILSATKISVAQKKRKKSSKPKTNTSYSIYEQNTTCNPINELAKISISKNGELILGSSKVEKENLTKELTRYVCDKLPFERIVYLSADSDILYSQLSEVIRLARKTDVDDFELQTKDGSKTAKIKIPMEEEIAPTKKVKLPLLSLILSIESDGKIRLNNKPETLDSVKQKLNKTFLTRKQKNIYIQGTSEVQKTVFIYAFKDVKFGDVINLVKEVETTGAFPIALDIDDDFLRIIFN